MLIEAWSFEVAPGKWQEAMDWSKRITEAMKRRKEVVNCRSCRRETGASGELNRIIALVEFEDMMARVAHYKDRGEEVQDLMKEFGDNGYGDKWGHNYFQVFA